MSAQQRFPLRGTRNRWHPSESKPRACLHDLPWRGSAVEERESVPGFDLPVWLAVSHTSRRAPYAVLEPHQAVTVAERGEREGAVLHIAGKASIKSKGMFLPWLSQPHRLLLTVLDLYLKATHTNSVYTGYGSGTSVEGWLWKPAYFFFFPPSFFF